LRRSFRSSHILFPIKTDATAAGSAFDLDHLSLSAKDRAAIPQAVYEKAEGDGIAKRKLGPDALWLHLKPLWPDDKPHLSIGEMTEWFAAYVYLPKLRDGVVLQGAIREAVSKLDPAFGYADAFDESLRGYRGLVWAKATPSSCRRQPSSCGSRSLSISSGGRRRRQVRGQAPAAD